MNKGAIIGIVVIIVIIIVGGLYFLTSANLTHKTTTVSSQLTTYTSTISKYSTTVTSVPTTNTITVNPLLLAPEGIAYDPHNNYMYVLNENKNSTVSVISNRTIIAIINFTYPPNLTYSNGTLAGTHGLHSIAYNPINNYMYVELPGFSKIALINNTSVVSSISTQSSPSVIAFDPANNYTYATGIYTTYNGSIMIINGTRIIKTINVTGYPTGIAYDPANKEMYISLSNGFMGEVIIMKNMSILATIQKGADLFDVSYNPAIKGMFVSDYNLDSIYEIVNSSIVKTITLNYSGIYSPLGMAYSPADNFTYVASEGAPGPYILFINGTYPYLTSSYSLFAPTGLAYDPVSKDMYVTNFDDYGDLYGVNASDVYVYIVNKTQIVGTISSGN